MIFDWDELRVLQANKLLSIVPHESGDYWILNYTPQAQYSHAWDAHPVLLDCRGTIIRADGSVVAKPFRKFFNLGERPETTMDALTAIPNNHSYCEVADKLDGSMITLWRADTGAVNFATRGSFTSPQAQMAEQLWMTRHAGADTQDGYTYIFEYVGPSNRIVVQYPEERLILTGLVETETGEELSYNQTITEAERLGLASVRATCGDDWFDLPGVTRPNFEGFVVFWSHVQRRIKVKLAEYVRLHRIITGLSEHTIWEILATGGSAEDLRREIPEEMHAWFDGVTAELSRLHVRRVTSVDEALRQIVAEGLDPKDRTDRKEIAQWVKRSCPEISGEVFRALDDKDYQSLIWKQIEPKAVPIFKDADA